MIYEKKKLIYTLCGFIVGSVVSTVCISTLAKRNQSKKPEKEMGMIVIYPDEFETDQLYLELNCTLEELKSVSSARFKIYYDKKNKKIQIKENFAKS